MTGSSALPQKQNPDIAELARGRAATVLGDVTALLALQKGLPLAYQRDLQEDKALVFHADDTLAATLEALGAMLAGARFHPPPPFGVDRGARPGRAAHRARRAVPPGPPGSGTAGGVARWRMAATSASATADDLAADPLFEPDDLEAIDPGGSVARRLITRRGQRRQRPPPDRRHCAAACPNLTGRPARRLSTLAATSRRGGVIVFRLANDHLRPGARID